VIRRVRLEADRIKDPVIACFGIAYEADIDDLRESPALDITQALAESGCGEILVVEPNVTQLPARLLEAGARGVDCLKQPGTEGAPLPTHRHVLSTWLPRRLAQRGRSLSTIASIRARSPVGIPASSSSSCSSLAAQALVVPAEVKYSGRAENRSQS
jgi:hypothetical protein